MKRFDRANRLGVTLVIAIAVAGSATSSLAAKSSQPSEAAIDAERTKAYDQCMHTGDAAHANDFAMADCSKAELGRQDQKLNAVYSALMKGSLSSAEKAKIKEQDRKWLKGRNAACLRAASINYGGTAEAVDYADCLVDSTIKQRLTLQAYLK